MQPLLTPQQCRRLDHIAIEERGVPSLDLMERAARAVAEATEDLLSDRRRENEFAPAAFCSGGSDKLPEPVRALLDRRRQDSAPWAAVFCGPGNNGGDGLAAARLLLQRGVSVRTILVGDWAKMTADAREMARRLQAVGGEIEAFDPDDLEQSAWLGLCDCAIDALLGVGLKRPVQRAFLAAVRRLNSLSCPVVACDLPTGLDGDTGRVLGEAVRADMTVTFTAAKPGLYLDQGRVYSGQVRVIDIGLPDDLTAPLLTEGDLWAVKGPDTLPRRPRTAHKGDFGKLFLLCGSVGFTGAPVFAARSAVRSGAGLVFLAVPEDIYPIVAVKCDEAMPFPIPDDYDALLARAKGCDAAVLGPGLGADPAARELARKLLQDLPCPVVLDADGINALAGHIDILDSRSAPTLLTPHDGEFQRLTGCTLPLEDRLAAARDFAAAHRCGLILKGHATVTAAPDGRAWVNVTGNPGMAKGGSGDVLSGIAAGLWGQKHLRSGDSDLWSLAAQAVAIHAACGDLCARESGEYAMTPGDMVCALPKVFKALEPCSGT